MGKNNHARTDKKKVKLHAHVEKSKAQSRDVLTDLSLADYRLVALRDMLGLDVWPKGKPTETAINEVIQFLQSSVFEQIVNLRGKVGLDYWPVNGSVAAAISEVTRLLHSYIRDKKFEAEGKEYLHESAIVDDRVVELREMLGLVGCREDGSSLTAIDEVLEFLQTSGVIEFLQSSEVISE